MRKVFAGFLVAVILLGGDLIYRAWAQTNTFCPTSTAGTPVPCSVSNPWTFTQQLISSVATGAAPFSIASTTVVPNLNAQFHNGLTAPGSAIVGVSDTQALTTKTFDISLNTLKTATNTAGHYPRNNGTQYVDNTIQATDVPVFVASGASHAPGAVPDPGAAAGTTRFLREDATWVAPTGGVNEALLSGGSTVLGSQVGEFGNMAFLTNFSHADPLVNQLHRAGESGWGLYNKHGRGSLGFHGRKLCVYGYGSQRGEFRR